MKFIEELKKRNVFKTIGIYSAAALITIQVADIVLPRLLLPDWTVTFIIILVMIGFPVTFFLSWTYNLDPNSKESSISLENDGIKLFYGIDYNGSIISPFTEKDGMEQPIKYWVPSIAPSDMLFYEGQSFPELQGNLLITSLVPGDIRKISIDKSSINEEIIFKEIKGRIRSIKASKEGDLIVLTDGPKGNAYIISK